MVSVDLNADLGESFGAWKLGDDDAMLDLVTSANVACGFHAGDPATLSRTARKPHEQGVRIGAQVGYRDLAGFGRRFIDVTPDDLTADVIYQIGALQALAHVAGSIGQLCQTPWRAVQHDRQQPRPGPRCRGGGACRRPGSAGTGIGGLGVLRRGASASDCAPCRRRSPTARIAPTDNWFRAGSATPCCTTPPRSPSGWRRWCSAGRVVAVDGSTIPITVESVCVHGDSPGAVQIATAVRDRLVGDGVELAAFV